MAAATAVSEVKSGLSRAVEGMNIVLQSGMGGGMGMMGGFGMSNAMYRNQVQEGLQAAKNAIEHPSMGMPLTNATVTALNPVKASIEAAMKELIYTIPCP